MLQQDHLTRIVNVQWGGAVEIPQVGTLGAAVTNPNVETAHPTAITISGWVWVPEGTPSGSYPLMIFGGDSVNLGWSEIEADVRPDGTFRITSLLQGVPFLSDPAEFEYAVWDYYGWVKITQQSPGGEPTHGVPTTYAAMDWNIIGVHALCLANGGTIAPCGFEQASAALLAQRASVNQDPALVTYLRPSEWHHFIITADPGGIPTWASGDGIPGFLFVNGQSAYNHFPGSEGLITTLSQVGLAEATEFTPGVGWHITGKPAGIPRPSSEIANWPQTPIRFCDWQVYPRFIDPNQHIDKFFRIEDGIRKRVSTTVAANAFGVPVGNPPVNRQLWHFKGGGSSFHKSGPRSTDGEFVKIGVIKTVPPPPLWSPPA